MSVPAFEGAFEKVSKLAATFQANEARYLSPDYQEAEARKDFIDKFFIALGWDVNHDEQTNPYEQEVKVEPAVSAAGQRRADYAFHLAPNYRDVRFFVEAKKPHGDIATADNYFQTIRYGWNSETPLAALTDFEQLHVLDCRGKPDIETALFRHVARYHYREYIDRKKFAEIYWLFSREAVADGSLEKRAKELPKPRGKARQLAGLFPGGYQSIDESFLKELDEYRTALAHTFKNKNPKLDSETLTELTQRTLDRLVFLRFLEDKGIEPQRIVDGFGDKGTAWEDFIAASRRLDGIYNGIVFKHHDILDGDKFRVDDTAFADICESLAHINSPYDFNAIPIHILGSIYERFLGNVIVATDKRATVEPKPEVRKAGGVYYTPEYIVRYIVENTVGKLIASKTPDQIAEMRFADIACGSGSFLLGVFDLLLTYHGHYYNDNPRKARKGDCINHDGKLYLSLRKKREILLDNIYGVDIDAQAVEVCQLSLYLRLLQDETTASTHQYLLEFTHIAQMKKLLPDLSKNIVCGNSLIGRDILKGRLFASEEERKLNPMDFEDAFPEVMKRGGFDAVVGNPPYVRQETIGEFKLYFKSHYESFHGVADLYVYFIEKGVRLLAHNGLFGIIVANKWLRTNYGFPIRQWLKRKRIIQVIDFGDLPVFKGATIYPSILCIQNAAPLDDFDVTVVRSLDFRDLSKYAEDNAFSVQLSSLGERGWSLAGERAQLLLVKLRRSCLTLKEFVGGQIYYGIKTGFNEAFVVGQSTRKSMIDEDPRNSELIKPFLVGKDIKRYQPPHSDRFVLFTRRGVDILKYPTVKQYLSQFKERLTPRPRNWRGQKWHGRKPGPYQWYEIQDTVAYYREFEGPKIVWPGISAEITAFTLDEAGYYGNDNTQILVSDDRYLLGILNSHLMRFFLLSICDKVQGGFYRLKITYVEQAPIRSINLSDPADKARHDEMVTRVDAMLEAKMQLAKAKTDKDKTYYENKCAALDRQIDSLVYELYGLTEKEIQIVERQK